MTEAKDVLHSAVNLKISYILNIMMLKITIPILKFDIIYCRDIFSFYDYNEQLQILSEIYEKLKNGGLLILGENEEIVFNGLVPDENNGIRFYKKLIVD